MKYQLIVLCVSLSFVATQIQSQECINCSPPSNSDAEYTGRVGLNNTADGDYSFAGGIDSYTNGRQSFAYGNGVSALGNTSFAFGANSTANNLGSFVVGQSSFGTGTFSITLGSRLKTYGLNTITIGSGPVNGGELINFEEGSIMLGSNSINPTLFISKPQNEVYPHVNTGRIGIGNVTDPLYKLHLKSDEGETAGLFLQPNDWDLGYQAQLKLGTENQGFTASKDVGIEYEAEGNHIFKGGDVYIENIEHGIIMKSPSGTCWRGVLDDNGQLNFSPMESCPDMTVGMGEDVPGNTADALKLYPNPGSDAVTLSFPNPDGHKAKIEVYNINGQWIESHQVQDNKLIINTSAYSPGWYIIKVQVGAQSYSSKLQVVHTH